MSVNTIQKKDYVPTSSELNTIRGNLYLSQLSSYLKEISRQSTLDAEDNNALFSAFAKYADRTEKRTELPDPIKLEALTFKILENLKEQPDADFAKEVDLLHKRFFAASHNTQLWFRQSLTNVVLGRVFTDRHNQKHLQSLDKMPNLWSFNWHSIDRVSNLIKHDVKALSEIEKNAPNLFKSCIALPINNPDLSFDIYGKQYNLLDLLHIKSKNELEHFTEAYPSLAKHLVKSAMVNNLKQYITPNQYFMVIDSNHHEVENFAHYFPTVYSAAREELSSDIHTGKVFPQSECRALLHNASLQLREQINDNKHPEIAFRAPTPRLTSAHTSSSYPSDTPWTLNETLAIISSKQAPTTERRRGISIFNRFRGGRQ